MKKFGLILIVVIALLLAGASIASAQGGTMHRVTYGDTMYSIAGRYGVPVDAIMQLNGLVNPNMIYIGQPLLIPTAGYHNPGYAPGPGCGNHHIVVPGETLSGIAYRYGIPVHEISAMNNLYNQDMVYVGQQLCVPGGYAPQPEPVAHYGPPSNAYYHTVAYGETLYSICDQYGVNYGDVLRANNLANGGFIVEGQRLHIPGYAPPAPAPAHSAPAYAGPPPPAAPIVEEIVIADAEIGHARPHPVVPPLAPAYKEGVHKVSDVHHTPASPEYQESPAQPLLPEAEHPIEVVVNGGGRWVGEVYPNFPDPDGDTVLIVSTRESDKPTVWLRSGDYQVKGELGLVPEFGIDQYRFAFRYIPPGSYDVWFEDPDGTPSDKVPVQVEAGQRVEVNFAKGVGFSGPTYASPDGWILANWNNPSKPGENLGGWSNILVRTPASGLWVTIESEGGGYNAKCFTGSKGPGACDFAGLNAGLYWIKIEGTGLTLKTYMDGNAYAEFEFARQPTDSKEDRDSVGPVYYGD